jgi:type IV pilus assembly protein PilM
MKLRAGKSKSKNTSVVGLDVDPSHIAAAEVDPAGGLTITRGVVTHLRPGILRDGELADGPALSEALREFFDANDLPRRVRLGVASQRIVVRTLDLPPLEDAGALAAAVKVEAPDHLPMPMDEAVVDFQPLGIVDTPDGPRARVVVVAVRREMIDRLAGAVAEAGLELDGVDLSAFAMVRALAPDIGDATQVYVSLTGLTNVAVANNSGCLFTRAATGGLDALVSTLSERRGLTIEHARQWMGHVGLTDPLEEIEGDAEVIGATRSVLEDGAHQIADTVRNSINFFSMQEGAIPGFAEALSAQLALPVTIGQVGGADLAGTPDDAHRLTVAAGLAVEERE